jgi:hypothetical protein
MTPEEFAKVAEAVAAGETVTPEQAVELISMVRRMDILTLIFQNALELMSQNTYESIPAMGEKVLQRCGRTDHKSKKAVAEQAAGLVAQCDASLQGYITTAMLEAAGLLNITIEELLGIPAEDVTSNPSAQEPSA